MHNITGKCNVGVPYTINKERMVLLVYIWSLKIYKWSVRSLFYFVKTQDVCDNNNEFLKENDILLVMMNETQTALSKNVGNNVIANDGTGMISNFTQLIIVLDNVRQELLYTFMITHCRDEVIFRLFYDDMKSNVGIISINTFMSYMAYELYSECCHG